MIYPQNFEEKIGFCDIRKQLSTKCLSPLGREKVDAIAFSIVRQDIEQWLTETTEFVSILTGEDEFPASYFFDMRESLRRIRIEGLYLDEGELFDLRRSLQTVSEIVRFLRPEDWEETHEEKSEEELIASALYPHLFTLTSPVSESVHVVRRIDQLLDKYGKMRDTASPTLLKIRKELQAELGGLSHKLHRILREAQAQGYVDKDVAPSMRDGRLVIPVIPAMKRKISGIVYDESATGKTLFIEPTEVVEANNRIRELEGEERREIIRILVDFSDFLRPIVEDLLQSYSFLAEIDFIRAKALLSIQQGAIQPRVHNNPRLGWWHAIHPLLQNSLKKHGKQVVPLDLYLEKGQRILLISGPNAGGKSVCLKTVGLLQYMLQCGLHIPISAQSETGIFHDLFIDIGDEQSIEDELSTYSSHLTNMKHTLRGAGKRSLVLIDEFGGGTEPQIGGAIAEAILSRLNENGVFGIITTHYQNLKHFAEDHEGVVNGAMLYDRHEMQALFQLRIGNPGSSFAIEIARKIGLPEAVIQEASNLVGHDYVNADKYLQDIVRDKRYWEQKRQSIRQAEKQMEETTARYEEAISSLKTQRKEILQTAKKEAEQILKESNAAIEATIRNIKEAQAEKEQTRAAREELNDFRKNLEARLQNEQKALVTQKMEQLQARQERKKKKKSETKNQPLASVSSPELIEKATSVSSPSSIKPIQVGNAVLLEGQKAVGIVLELKGKNAVVGFGEIKSIVKTTRLVLTEAPQQSKLLKAATFVSVQTADAMREKRLHFKQDIDVRGMRGEEAIQAITYFIDDAILVGMPRVRILHGTGTGILRTLIRQYLATINGVAHYQDEHVQFGGAGITVVDLE